VVKATVVAADSGKNVDGMLFAVTTTVIPVLLVLPLSAARRTREIGIRLAVGATPRALLAALFKRAALQIGAGVVVGNLLVVALMSVIVEQASVVPMLAASLIMVIVGIAACFVPVRRALRVQPTEALGGRAVAVR
jgi:putative ABC transport system permease protein